MDVNLPVVKQSQKNRSNLANHDIKNYMRTLDTPYHAGKIYKSTELRIFWHTPAKPHFTVINNTASDFLSPIFKELD